MNVLIAYIIITTATKYQFVFLNIGSSLSPIYVVFWESIIVSQIFMNMYTTMGQCLLHCLFQDVALCRFKGEDILQGKDRPNSVKRMVQLLLKKNKPKDETEAIERKEVEERLTEVSDLILKKRPKQGKH